MWFITIFLLRCDSCPSTFLTRKLLNNHKPRHKKENYIICTVEGCGHRLFKNDRFGHMRQKHTFQTQICEICSRTFRNGECLRKHKYKVHDSYKCMGCRSRVLKRSRSQHNCSNKFEIKEKVEKETPHRCMDCEKSYTSSYLLRRHMKIKHRVVIETESSQPSLTCKSCSKEFKNSRDLNRHRKLCTCILCSICSAPFKNQEKLDLHMEKHDSETRERIFPCSSCSCRFVNQRVLSIHILKKHTTNEVEVNMNFECPRCDIHFRKPYLLKLHMESRHEHIVEGVERTCVICFKICDAELPFHMQEEHKKDYGCTFEGCKKKFRTADSLTSHERVHAEGYVEDLSCSVCMKKCNNKKTLSEHFKNHAIDSKEKKPRQRKKKNS